MVEIEQHHRERLGDAFQSLVKSAGCGVAVGQPGQCIGVGHPLQLISAVLQCVAMLQRAAIARVQQGDDGQHRRQHHQQGDAEQALAVQPQRLDVVVALQELAFRFRALPFQAGFQQRDLAGRHVDSKLLVQCLVGLAGRECAGGIAGTQLQFGQQVEQGEFDDSIAEVAHVHQDRGRFRECLRGSIACCQHPQVADPYEDLVAHRDVVVGGIRLLDPAFGLIDAPLQQAQFRHPGVRVDAVGVAARLLGQSHR